MVVNPERSGPWSIVCSGTVDPAALAGSVCCAWTVLAGPDRAKYPVLETKTREPMCSSIHSDSDPRAVWPVGICVSSYGRTSGPSGPRCATGRRPLVGPFHQNECQLLRKSQSRKILWAITRQNPERLALWAIVCAATAHVVSVLYVRRCSLRPQAVPQAVRKPAPGRKKTWSQCPLGHWYRAPAALWAAGTYLYVNGQSSAPPGPPGRTCTGVACAGFY